MTNPNDPAFPSEAEGVITKSFGLTKREYFAAMALRSCVDGYGNLQSGTAAKDAVVLADALLKELNNA